MLRNPSGVIPELTPFIPTVGEWRDTHRGDFLVSKDVDRTSALMQRYARGDDAVFQELYTLMAPRLYRFCLRLAGRKQDADDIFQDTFLRLHRARATYLSGTRPLHWAFAIARSVHLDRLRYRRRRPEQLGSEQDAAGDHSLEAADDRYNPEADVRALHLEEVVTLELKKMSEKNRVAYILLREEELSVQEAADLLGTTAAVVKQRAHRAYEHLRVAIGAAGWHPHSGASSGQLGRQVEYALCEP
jgi:RNA polymerase sigma-70 factor (ECF subfamily)